MNFNAVCSLRIFVAFQMFYDFLADSFMLMGRLNKNSVYPTFRQTVPISADTPASDNFAAFFHNIEMSVFGFLLYFVIRNRKIFRLLRIKLGKNRIFTRAGYHIASFLYFVFLYKLYSHSLYPLISAVAQFSSNSDISSNFTLAPFFKAIAVSSTADGGSIALCNSAFDLIYLPVS